MMIDKMRDVQLNAARQAAKASMEFTGVPDEFGLDLHIACTVY